MELGKCSLKDLYKYKELEPKQVNRLVYDTIKGLQDMYFQRIIHRDIKPDNILLMDDGSFKITDFGVSRQINDKENEITIVGTKEYFPDEVYKYFRGKVIILTKEESKTIDWYKFDTYSLGLTLLAAISQLQTIGYIVDFGQTFSELEKQKAKGKYDVKVYEIIHAMIQKKQEDRPTLSELLMHAQDLEF